VQRVAWSTLSLLSIAAVLAAEPPMSKRIEQEDVYHGVTIQDPYRWLETDVRESQEVAQWVETQNKHTFAYLEEIPQRQQIKERLTKLWDFEKYGTPFKAGGRIYFEKNDGLQNQYVLYVQDSLEDEPRVLIDPNEWSEDGTIALGDTSFSDDGRYMAYSVQEAGSDWQVWNVMEIETGRLLEDELKWIKFNSPAWTIDGNGFFYARFPEPQAGATFQDLNLNQKVYYHRVGRPQLSGVLPRPRRTVRHADAAGRPLPERIQLHRQRRAGVLLSDRPRRSSQTGDLDRHPRGAGGAGEIIAGRPSGRDRREGGGREFLRRQGR
jgi:prolyl oligopeptidase